MPRQDSRESLHHAQFYNDPRYEDNLPASTDPMKRHPAGYEPKRSTCERRFLNFQEYLKPPLYCFLAPPEDDVRYEDNRFYKEITDVCCYVFGVDEFRPCQLPSMTAALEGFDIILNSTTGSGKSLGYQVPAHIQRQHHNCVTLVFLPRQALVEKEIATGQHLNLKWNGSVAQNRRPDDLLNPAHRDFPEIFFLCYQALGDARYEKIKALCHSKHVARVVLDEAQLLFKGSAPPGESPAWLRNLVDLRTSHPSIPWTVLSATMTQSQRTRLLKEFKLGSCILIQGPVDRKNLHFAIEHMSVRTFQGSWGWKVAYVLALIKQRPGHQILVYCRKTKEVDDLRNQLIEHGPDGLKCAAYHGKNSEERDADFMEKWEKDCYDVVLATNALGLGVHKDDIRYVIHWSTPYSMDAYMQECGRAGRDGKPAKCILFYSYWDTLDALSGAESDKYAPAIKDALPVIKMAEAPWTCRRIPILTYYGEQHDPAFTCGNCDVCFAADSGLPHTIDIRQDIERIKGLFERPGRREFLTRTAVLQKVGHSRHNQRVLEYLVFKGVLKELPYMTYRMLRCGLMMGSRPEFTTMPVQRPPRLPKLRQHRKHRQLPIDPSPRKQATRVSERSSDDSACSNLMDLDEPEDGPEEDELAVHERRAELDRPMGDSDLGRIDRQCFDVLSAWLSEQNVSASRKLRKFLVEHRDDPRYRDLFGLRPDLMNSGVSRDEINRVLYNRDVFPGINMVLDRYVDSPLSRKGRKGRMGRMGQNPSRLAHVPN